MTRSAFAVWWGRACVGLGAACLAAPAGACGGESFDRDALEIYTPPGGDYAVRYLAPPWRVEEVEDERVRLVVRSPFAEGEEDAFTYDLTVDVVAGRAAQRAAQEVARAMGRGEAVYLDDTFETDAGVEGRDVWIKQRAVLLVFRRFLFFDLPGGRVVQVSIRSVPSPDADVELDTLLRALEIGADTP